MAAAVAGSNPESSLPPSFALLPLQRRYDWSELAPVYLGGKHRACA